MAPECPGIASRDWPDLPFSDWADTCATLHLWMQIAGKVRLAHAPMVNHWWQVAFYVTCRGLTTSPIPYDGRTFQIDFDFIDHNLTLRTSTGESETMALCPRTVADFYDEFIRRLRGLGLETRNLDHAGRDPRRNPVRARQGARFLRRGLCHAVLAHSGPGGPAVEAVPRAIPRQGRVRCISSGAVSIWRSRAFPGAGRPEYRALRPIWVLGSCRRPIRMK